MKASICLLTFLLSGLVQSAYAQGCRLDYTPEYDTYTTVTTDATNVYSTVLIDGSTSGDPSAGCNDNSATHTPQALNTLNGVGGTVNGTSGYMTSYISAQNDQEVANAADGGYTFTSQGSVLCSVFGNFYDAYFPGQLWTLSHTYGEYNGYQFSGLCGYNLACTSTPPSGHPTCPSAPAETYTDVQIPPCVPFVYTGWLSYDGGCAGVSIRAGGPGPCT
jgi:hypothetical protein